MLKGMGILFIGAVSILGIIWQLHILSMESGRRTPPKRVVIPMVLGGLSLSGILVHGFIAMVIDSANEFGMGDLFSNVFSGFTLFLTFTLKSYLGIAFTSLSISIILYFFIEYEQLQLWAMVEMVFKWICPNAPGWTKGLYTIVLYSVALGGSLYDIKTCNIS